MRRVGFGPECALKLAAALRANSSITRLNIERNGVGLSGGVAHSAPSATSPSVLTVSHPLLSPSPSAPSTAPSRSSPSSSYAPSSPASSSSSSVLTT